MVSFRCKQEKNKGVIKMRRVKKWDFNRQTLSVNHRIAQGKNIGPRCNADVNYAIQAHSQQWALCAVHCDNTVKLALG